MSRFSTKKPFTHEIFSRHVGEMRDLLHALELRDTFEDSETRPKTDIYETSQNVVIEFELPGFSLDAISLKISGMTLILEAYKPKEQNAGKFICVERSHGYFHHALHIPGNVDTGSVVAEYRKGVLCVICPKRAELSVPIKEL